MENTSTFLKAYISRQYAGASNAGEYWHFPADQAAMVERKMASLFTSWGELGWTVTDRSQTGAVHLESKS